MAQMSESRHPVVLAFERPLLALEREIHELEAGSGDRASTARLERLRKELATERSAVLEHLTPWQRVQIARHPGRLRPHEVCGQVLEGFLELHGDRISADDPGVVAGLGYLGRRRVAVVGHGRGRPGPDGRGWSQLPSAAGLRKAARVAELAARFQLPLLLLVDTPAARQVDSPEGSASALSSVSPGAASALVDLMGVLLDLPPPSLCVVLGESYGEHGVALMAADRVIFCEHAVCAPAPPEACAAAEIAAAGQPSAKPEHWEQAAEALGLTAADAVETGLADAVVEEPLGGAHRDPARMRETLQTVLGRDLGALRDADPEARLGARRARWEGLMARGVSA